MKPAAYGLPHKDVTMCARIISPREQGFTVSEKADTTTAIASSLGRAGWIQGGV